MEEKQGKGKGGRRGRKGRTKEGELSGILDSVGSVIRRANLFRIQV
jgi:hypothetical protein